MRIGHGFDAHKFSNKGTLILGGVQFQDTPKMEAHSDGDVLVHALCDALLGAAALGDIGKHFPDSTNEFKDIDSRILLRKVVQQLTDLKYVVCNIDITVIAQTPKLANKIDSMKVLLAEDCAVELNQLNIKATTTEKMGYIGRKEGIAVHAVVLID